MRRVDRPTAEILPTAIWSASCRKSWTSKRVLRSRGSWRGGRGSGFSRSTTRPRARSSTASIPVTESVGSGSGQSHAVFTNPKAIHIAESGDVSLETSTDFALESGDVALRVGHKIAFGYQPAASLVVLAGI